MDAERFREIMTNIKEPLNFYDLTLRFSVESGLTIAQTEELLDDAVVFGILDETDKLYQLAE